MTKTKHKCEAWYNITGSDSITFCNRPARFVRYRKDSVSWLCGLHKNVHYGMLISVEEYEKLEGKTP